METEQIAPGVTKASLFGRLDFNGTQEIDPALSAAAASQRGLIVDLSQVEFIASLGLRLLIVVAHTLQRTGGRMVLLGPAAAVEAVLISSGIDALVPILRHPDEAIRSVSA